MARVYERYNGNWYLDYIDEKGKRVRKIIQEE
jgi:hypothetical protein